MVVGRGGMGMVGSACRLSPGGKRAFFFWHKTRLMWLCRSDGAGPPASHLGCRAKLVSPPLLPPTPLTWTWSETSGDAWGRGGRHVSVPWCCPQGPPKGSPSLEPPARPTLPPAQDHDWSHGGCSARGTSPAQPKFFGWCCRPNLWDAAMGPHQFAVAFISPKPREPSPRALAAEPRSLGTESGFLVAGL